MFFNSYNFVLYFMPILLIGYYIIGKYFRPAVAHLWLLAFSMFFCLSHGVWETLLLLADVAFNYALAVAIIKVEKQNLKKTAIYAAVIINVCTLLLLKYLGFFASIGEMFTKRDISVPSLLMPIGISYLTFRMIGFVVDVYKGKITIPSFVNFLIYCFYFPMLVQGPITSAKFFLPQLSDDEHVKFNSDRFAKGLYWFVMGLLKKLLLADTLSKSITWGFANAQSLTSSDTIILMLILPVQLYFDFTGYCDMAAGVSEMLGITLPVNFDSPYKSKSVGEIWRRWHITLGDFLREYLYFPLGGSKKGELRTYINIIIVFTVSGLWHGASLTYVLWGLINGVAQAFERTFNKAISKLNDKIRWFLTYVFWNVTVFIFRSENFTQFWKLFTAIFKNHSFGVTKDFFASASLFELEYVEEHMGTFGEMISLGHLPVFLIISFIVIFGMKNLYEKEFKPTVCKAVFTGVALFWCVVSLGGITSFLYAIY